MTCVRRGTCRVCGSTDLEQVVDLGSQPLANAFLDPGDEDKPEPHYPLVVFFCRSCSLVQLLDVVDPEVLFRDYIYVTGISEAMRLHFRDYAHDVQLRLGLNSGAIVLEAASNDGTLLREFRELGLDVVGVEPATNVARMANDDGVPTHNDFFTVEVAGRITHQVGNVDVVIGNNVLAHVDGCVEFLQAAAAAIKPNGAVVVEVPYVGEMLNRLEYDTIYHEHLCYFSVTALTRLFGEAGLRIDRIDHTPVHGGSLRVWGKMMEASSDDAVTDEYRKLETDNGVATVDRYRDFGRQVGENRRQLRAMLEDLKADGCTVAAYGAPAKGNTLLNYCAIGTDLLPFTVDRSPLKVGKVTPGMHLPVLPVEALLERRPSHTLILPWNLADEIVQQQSEYQRLGGRFIVPVPEPRIAEPVG